MTTLNDRPVFGLFQGYAISSVLASLGMTGLLPTLAGPDGLTADAIAERGGERGDLLAASLRYLTARGLAAESGGGFTLTDQGRQVCDEYGYLVWLVGGYGEPLRRMDAFLEGSHRYGDDYPRDGRWVADGAAIIGKTDVVPEAMKLLERNSFSTVLDLGCGNARFLVKLCEKFGSNGIGVDLSPAACESAEKLIAESSIPDKVRVEVGDAGALDKVPGLDNVDLVVTFFLLHEILASGRDVLVDYLQKMSKAIPSGARLLIAEVEPPRADGDTEQRFTPEFTLVHNLMRQFLITAEEWTSVLADGGFAVKEVIRCGMPGGILILCDNQS